MVTKNNQVSRFPIILNKFEPSGNIHGFQNLNYFRLASLPLPPPGGGQRNIIKKYAKKYLNPFFQGLVQVE